MKKQKKRYEGGLAMESKKIIEFRNICLLYTSDAADEL